MKIKIGIVLGTRPEILKFVPIIRELKERKIDHRILFTNQHFSKEMGKDFFKEFGITDYTFPIPELYEPSIWLREQLIIYKPDVVLVQGDTFSAFVGAETAFNLGIKIAHIEAGLRTFNLRDPFPEERYRTQIDLISDYLFCPTSVNYYNIVHLLANYPNKKADIVGNTIIDLIKSFNVRTKKSKDYVLITAHRRENWDKMKDICKGVNKVARKFPKLKFIFVTHKNPDLVTKVNKYLKGKNIEILPPQGYKEFITLLSEAKAIFSDSGGIAEEASYLSTPILILREHTERVEVLEQERGLMCSPTAKNIFEYGKDMLFNISDYTESVCPYGVGNTAKKIIYILEEEFR